MACLLIVAVGPLALTLLRAERLRGEFSIAQAAPCRFLSSRRREQVAGIQLVMGAITTSPALQRDVLAEVDWPDRPKQVIEADHARAGGGATAGPKR